MEDENSTYSVRPNDLPTKFAHLGWRFVYTLVAWGILEIGPSTGKGYFTALFMFAVPLMMDYAKFKPDTRLRIWMWRVGIGMSVLWILVALFGFFEALDVVLTEDKDLFVTVTAKSLVASGVMFQLKYLWYFIGSSVILTGIDCIIWESNAEIAAKKAFKEHVGVEQ